MLWQGCQKSIFKQTNVDFPQNSTSSCLVASKAGCSTYKMFSILVDAKLFRIYRLWVQISCIQDLFSDGVPNTRTLLKCLKSKWKTLAMCLDLVVGACQTQGTLIINFLLCLFDSTRKSLRLFFYIYILPMSTL